MFDGEVEDKDEFETSVTSSIQKALSALWCSYKFPFRNKTHTIYTQKGIQEYDTPNGNIVQKTVRGKNVYGVKYGKTYLDYLPDYELLEDKTGIPKGFYIKNDKLCLYPVPDDIYKIDAEYLTIFTSCDVDGNSKATLEEDDDYIDIPEKYDDLFEKALITLSMVYAIASQPDENYAGYQEQYEKAYKNLIEFTQGIELNKRIGWR